MTSNYSAINWNVIPDQLDKTVWDRLTANFWLPEAIPVSNDLPSWNKMPEDEKELIRKVFVSLTLLDTLQGSVGMPSLMEHARTQHSEAVLSNIAFMEHVHAKSYSTIFSTLCSSQETNELFQWAANEPLLQATAKDFQDTYIGGTPAGKYAISVFSESFLFYTGFYAPLRMAAEGKLTNTADIIRLILRDEGVHGYYIGAKFQELRKHEAPVPDELYQAELMRLYDREKLRVEMLYKDVGWVEEVQSFLRYNANKALSNLGIEAIFDPRDTEVPAYIMSALDPGTGETFDFFSGSGSSYVIGKVEETQESDWDF